MKALSLTKGFRSTDKPQEIYIVSGTIDQNGQKLYAVRVLQDSDIDSDIFRYSIKILDANPYSFPKNNKELEKFRDGEKNYDEYIAVPRSVIFKLEECEVDESDRPPQCKKIDEKKKMIVMDQVNNTCSNYLLELLHPRYDYLGSDTSFIKPTNRESLPLKGRLDLAGKILNIIKQLLSEDKDILYFPSLHGLFIKDGNNQEGKTLVADICGEINAINNQSSANNSFWLGDKGRLTSFEKAIKEAKNNPDSNDALQNFCNEIQNFLYLSPELFVEKSAFIKPPTGKEKHLWLAEQHSIFSFGICLYQIISGKITLSDILADIPDIKNARTLLTKVSPCTPINIINYLHKSIRNEVKQWKFKRFPEALAQTTQLIEQCLSATVYKRSQLEECVKSIREIKANIDLESQPEEKKKILRPSRPIDIPLKTIAPKDTITGISGKENKQVTFKITTIFSNIFSSTQYYEVISSETPSKTYLAIVTDEKRYHDTFPDKVIANQEIKKSSIANCKYVLLPKDELCNISINRSDNKELQQNGMVEVETTKIVLLVDYIKEEKSLQQWLLKKLNKEPQLPDTYSAKRFQLCKPVIKIVKEMHDNNLIFPISVNNVMCYQNEEEKKIFAFIFNISDIINPDTSVQFNFEYFFKEYSNNKAIQTFEILNFPPDGIKKQQNKDIYSLGITLYQILTGKGIKEDIIPAKSKIEKLVGGVVKSVKSAVDFYSSFASKSLSDIEKMANPSERLKKRAEKVFELKDMLKSFQQHIRDDINTWENKNPRLKRLQKLILSCICEDETKIPTIGEIWDEFEDIEKELRQEAQKIPRPRSSLNLVDYDRKSSENINSHSSSNSDSKRISRDLLKKLPSFSVSIKNKNGITEQIPLSLQSEITSNKLNKVIEGYIITLPDDYFDFVANSESDNKFILRLQDKNMLLNKEKARIKHVKFLDWLCEYHAYRNFIHGVGYKIAITSNEIDKCRSKITTTEKECQEKQKELERDYEVKRLQLLNQQNNTIQNAPSVQKKQIIAKFDEQIKILEQQHKDEITAVQQPVDKLRREQEKQIWDKKTLESVLTKTRENLDKIITQIENLDKGNDSIDVKIKKVQQQHAQLTCNYKNILKNEDNRGNKDIEITKEKAEDLLYNFNRLQRMIKNCNCKHIVPIEEAFYPISTDDLYFNKFAIITPYVIPQSFEEAHNAIKQQLIDKIKQSSPKEKNFHVFDYTFYMLFLIIGLTEDLATLERHKIFSLVDIKHLRCTRKIGKAVDIQEIFLPYTENFLLEHEDCVDQTIKNNPDLLKQPDPYYPPEFYNNFQTKQTISVKNAATYFFGYLLSQIFLKIDNVDEDSICVKELINSCLDNNQAARPSFKEIHEKLKNIIISNGIYHMIIFKNDSWASIVRKTEYDQNNIFYQRWDIIFDYALQRWDGELRFGETQEFWMQQIFKFLCDPLGTQKSIIEEEELEEYESNKKLIVNKIIDLFLKSKNTANPTTRLIPILFTCLKNLLTSIKPYDFSNILSAWYSSIYPQPNKKLLFTVSFISLLINHEGFTPGARTLMSFLYTTNDDVLWRCFSNAVNVINLIIEKNQQEKKIDEAAKRLKIQKDDYRLSKNFSDFSISNADLKNFVSSTDNGSEITFIYKRMEDIQQDIELIMRNITEEEKQYSIQDWKNFIQLKILNDKFNDPKYILAFEEQQKHKYVLTSEEWQKYYYIIDTIKCKYPDFDLQHLDDIFAKNLKNIDDIINDGENQKIIGENSEHENIQYIRNNFKNIQKSIKFQTKITVTKWIEDLVKANEDQVNLAKSVAHWMISYIKQTKNIDELKDFTNETVRDEFNNILFIWKQTLDFTAALNKEDSLLHQQMLSHFTNNNPKEINSLFNVMQKCLLIMSKNNLQDFTSLRQNSTNLIYCLFNFANVFKREALAKILDIFRENRTSIFIKKFWEYLFSNVTVKKNCDIDSVKYFINNALTSNNKYDDNIRNFFILQELTEEELKKLPPPALSSSELYLLKGLNNERINKLIKSIESSRGDFFWKKLVKLADTHTLIQIICPRLPNIEERKGRITETDKRRELISDFFWDELLKLANADTFDLKNEKHLHPFKRLIQTLCQCVHQLFCTLPPSKPSKVAKWWMETFFSMTYRSLKVEVRRMILITILEYTEKNKENGEDIYVFAPEIVKYSLDGGTKFPNAPRFFPELFMHILDAALFTYSNILKNLFSIAWQECIHSNEKTTIIFAPAISKKISAAVLTLANTILEDNKNDYSNYYATLLRTVGMVIFPEDQSFNQWDEILNIAAENVRTTIPSTPPIFLFTKKSAPILDFSAFILNVAIFIPPSYKALLWNKIYRTIFQSADNIKSNSTKSNSTDEAENNQWINIFRCALQQPLLWQYIFQFGHTEKQNCDKLFLRITSYKNFDSLCQDIFSTTSLNRTETLHSFFYFIKNLRTLHIDANNKTDKTFLEESEKICLSAYTYLLQEKLEQSQMRGAIFRFLNEDEFLKSEDSALFLIYLIATLKDALAPNKSEDSKSFALQQLVHTIFTSCSQDNVDNNFGTMLQIIGLTYKLRLQDETVFVKPVYDAIFNSLFIEDSEQTNNSTTNFNYINNNNLLDSFLNIVNSIENNVCASLVQYLLKNIENRNIDGVLLFKQIFDTVMVINQGLVQFRAFFKLVNEIKDSEVRQKLYTAILDHNGYFSKPVFRKKMLSKISKLRESIKFGDDLTKLFIGIVDYLHNKYHHLLENEPEENKKEFVEAFGIQTFQNKDAVSLNLQGDVQYFIADKIGSGGGCNGIWKVFILQKDYQIESGIPYACKDFLVSNESQGKHPALIEAGAMQDLNIGGIPMLKNLLQRKDGDKIHYAILMTIIPGKNLEDYLSEQNRESNNLSNRFTTLKYVLEEVLELHTNPHAKYEHGDLSAKNIMCNHPSIFLCDFAAAGKMGNNVDDRETFATEGYLAPDIINNPRSTRDGSKDIFALGQIMIQMITRKTKLDINPALDPDGFKRYKKESYQAIMNVLKKNNLFQDGDQNKNNSIYNRLINLIDSCLSDSREQRLKIEGVIDEYREILQEIKNNKDIKEINKTNTIK
jgi:hypothetical protein